MEPELVVSQVLLWVVVIVLALACLALARQVGVLYERIAPAGALAMNKKLSGGDTAPPTEVVSITGHPLAIGGGNDKGKSQVLFFLSPGCPVCKTLLPILKSIHRRENSWLTIVLASDGDDVKTHQTFIKKQSIEQFPYVISEPLGIAYGISKLPYGVLIDEEGIISALGLINSREHLESLFEAKRLGQATIQDHLQSQSHSEVYDSELYESEGVKQTNPKTNAYS